MDGLSYSVLGVLAVSDASTGTEVGCGLLTRGVVFCILFCYTIYEYAGNISSVWSCNLSHREETWKNTKTSGSELKSTLFRENLCGCFGYPRPFYRHRGWLRSAVQRRGMLCSAFELACGHATTLTGEKHGNFNIQQHLDMSSRETCTCHSTDATIGTFAEGIGAPLWVCWLSRTLLQARRLVVVCRPRALYSVFHA